jgi:hypothetical protein
VSSRAGARSPASTALARPVSPAARLESQALRGARTGVSRHTARFVAPLRSGPSAHVRGEREARRLGDRASR